MILVLTNVGQSTATRMPPLEVNFSADDHTGLDFADLAIIGTDGRFRR